MSVILEKLVVLDLDETLIHATTSGIEGQKEDFTFDQYFVYKRPHLDYFLTELSKHFTLAIWSSGGDEYVTEIVNNIRPNGVEFAIVWGRSKCSTKRDRESDTYYYEKRLDKFKKKGYRLENILIVDDSAEKAACNYGNAIYVKEYTGDATDDELLVLLDYLISIKDVENFRKIEKRLWRKSMDGR